MLTNQEMYAEIRCLWFSIAKRELYHEDLYLYFEIPKKGRGYHGEGEFYIYTRFNRYYLSYSERGTENIIAVSENFIDIKFEIAIVMSDKIMYEIAKRYKRKYNKIDQESKIAIQMELLKNADKLIYRKAVENYKKYGTLKIWKDNE